MNALNLLVAARTLSRANSTGSNCLGGGRAIPAAANSAASSPLDFESAESAVPGREPSADGVGDGVGEPAMVRRCSTCVMKSSTLCVAALTRLAVPTTASASPGINAAAAATSAAADAAAHTKVPECFMETDQLDQIMV